MTPDYTAEKKRFYLSIARSMIVVLLIWLAFWLNELFSLQWEQFGMRPRQWSGLVGILTMPFLHADTQHLISNTFPLLFLGFGLYYFFQGKAALILIMLGIVSGMLTWLIAGSGIHIGASGVVYALAFFLTTISLIKMENSLLAYTLVIVFLYGSLVWGFFPQLFPEKHISWEGHLAGAIAGIALAFFYRNEGPKKKEYFLDEDEDDDSNELELEIDERL